MSDPRNFQHSTTWETVPLFVLIAIDAQGRVRAAQTLDKWVPNDFCRPGEIAFTLRVEDFQARHDHEVGL